MYARPMVPQIEDSYLNNYVNVNWQMWISVFIFYENKCHISIYEKTFGRYVLNREQTTGIQSI